MSKSIVDLLEGNKAWAADTKAEFPELLDQLAEGQPPQYLWIGCADSRVPANQVTNSKPGTIFVQRNIANMVVHTDNNLLSVIYYAVKVLKVKDVIICGHYGCGGVAAAMSNNQFGLIDNWLIHIKDVYRLHKAELDAIEDEKERQNRFVELNVQEQVNNLSMIPFVQEEWAKGDLPRVHGLVYDLKSGLLKDLEISVDSNKHLDKVYQYEG